MRSRICACNKKNVKKNHRHKCIRMHTYRIIHQSHFAIAETHAKASRRRDIRRSSEFFNITADLTRDASRDVIATQRTSSQNPLQTRLQLSLANKHHRESARGSDFANPGSFPQKKKKRNRTTTQKRRDFDKSRNEIEQPKQFQKYWAESCTDRFPAPRFSFFFRRIPVDCVSRLRF